MREEIETIFQQFLFESVSLINSCSFRQKKYMEKKEKEEIKQKQKKRSMKKNAINLHKTCIQKMRQQHQGL